MSVEDKTLAQVLQEAITAKLLELHVCLPAKILTYDSTTQKATVQPMTKRKLVSNDTLVTMDMPVLVDVPVQCPSANGGACYIHMPIKPDDLGIVVFSERSIEKYMAATNLNTVDTQDTRHHSLSDAVFIPGVRPFDMALESTSAENMTIKNGNLTITLDPDGKISITGATNEMLSAISEFMGAVINGRILTGIGVMGFINADKATMTTAKNKLDSLII